MALVFLHERSQHSELTEQAWYEYCVGEYFTRRGWKADRISEDNQLRPDWYINSDTLAFLCEVKTIESVHEGDSKEADFQKKFCTPLKHYFQQNKFSKFPYRITIDNHTMTIPQEQELRQFRDWLADCLLLFNQGTVPNSWEAVSLPLNMGVVYFSTYTFSNPRKNGPLHTIHLRLTDKPDHLKYNIFIPIYGGTNKRPIEKQINKAVKQLKKEAEIRNQLEIPQVLVLSFEGGIGFNLSQTLTECYRWLEFYDTLSAIALCWWKAQQDSWENMLTSWFLSFMVLYSSKSRNILPQSVFDDGYTTQYTDVPSFIEVLRKAGL